MIIHNEWNLPQANLDSEINVLFLLNEHVDLYFLLLNNSVHIIFLNLKKFKKILLEGKKDIGERVQKNVLLNANYDREMLYVHVVLNGESFPQISYDIFHLLDTFYLAGFFSPSYVNKNGETEN